MKLTIPHEPAPERVEPAGGRSRRLVNIEKGRQP